MKMQDVQRLLMAAGYYKGDIDGLIGPQTQTAANKIIARHKAKFTSNPDKWSLKRRMIGVAQVILNAAGHGAGEVDGYAGHNTNEAFQDWSALHYRGKKRTVTRPAPPKTLKNTRAMMKYPLQKDCPKFYGKPGKGGPVEDQMIMVDLPFAFRLDWQLSRKVKRIGMHKKCAADFLAAMNEVLRVYGYAKIQKLGIDRFAGCYNPRKMRGGNAWSMHSYACAVDFYAPKNGLKTRCPQAAFCDPAYKPFIDIMEKHGFLSLGRWIGRDWMHFQAARLR